jgi:ABC-2 type transport system permease protein
LGAFQLAHLAKPARLETGLSLVLLLVLLYWQVVPVISASLGAGLDMRKLLVYPVPHPKLFVVELLLRLTTGGEMLLVLTGGVIGLLRNPYVGGLRAVPRILVPVLIYIAFNAALASGLRSLLERLLARRRVREVVFLLFVLATAAPRLLIAFRVPRRSFTALEPLTQFAVLPWTAAARAILGHTEALLVLLLILWTLLAGWFGRMQFERNLRYDAMAAQATSGAVSPRRDSLIDRFYRLPSRIFRDPLAALIEKELRSLVRTPRFRMVFVMGFAFGLMVWVPMILGGRADRNGWLGHNFLVVVSIYALSLLGQVTYWNSFGFDRSAAQIYFCVPQPIRLTLAGKNIASLVFVYLEVLILAALTQVLRLAEGWRNLFETLLVVGICSLYMLAFGNISSVRFPRGVKPERISQGGASSRFQALVFMLYPLALVPVALAYLARYALASQLAFAVVLAFAAVLGLVVYWIGLDSAVESATTQRERMLRDLSAGDGPIAAE